METEDAEATGSLETAAVIWRVRVILTLALGAWGCI